MFVLLQYLCGMKIFVTGISTDVGKTVASAIIAQALRADYWKPVQAGDLHQSDSIKVKTWTDGLTVFPEAYRLNTPASPHLAAKLDGVKILLDRIAEPHTENHLVIEGAGGLLVPLNEKETIADLIKTDYKVIVVSRHYLGSISHTLLTLEALKARGLETAGIVFNGDANPASEEAILERFPVPVIGRIAPEPVINVEVIVKYAAQFQPNLQKLDGKV